MMIQSGLLFSCYALRNLVRYKSENFKFLIDKYREEMEKKIQETAKFFASAWRTLSIIGNYNS